MRINKIAIIGGGAAGFFAAFSCKKHYPSSEVTIYEKGSKLLQKVKVSGGGRCNVTHNAMSVSELSKNYPRGSKHLKKCFNQFGVQNTIDWFKERGINLKIESDNRMFPTTDDSQTITNCFLEEANNKNIEILLKTEVFSIEKTNRAFELTTKQGTKSVDKVVVASGGSPKLSGLQWLADMGHAIEMPVPSLFTFNMPKNPVTKLMGLSVENATAKIVGTKLQYSGPLLITHWGMSGPAILKLSAWGARLLSDQQYQFAVQINWTGDKTEDEIRVLLQKERKDKKMLANHNPLFLPARLWLFLLEKVEIDSTIRWIDLDKKSFNRLVNVLVNDQYAVNGKTTFKEEFVTCGGVSLQDVNFNTMESRKMPGLYFTGEVLDVDGITGGFNFQAAWSTGFVAGKLL